jgi:hypothetical protein
MVEDFLGETAGPSKSPSDPMAQAAIIPFYPNRMPLANHWLSPENAAQKLRYLAGVPSTEIAGESNGSADAMIEKLSAGLVYLAAAVRQNTNLEEQQL